MVTVVKDEMLWGSAAARRTMNDCNKRTRRTLTEIAGGFESGIII